MKHEITAEQFVAAISEAVEVYKTSGAPQLVILDVAEGHIEGQDDYDPETSIIIVDLWDFQSVIGRFEVSDFVSTHAEGVAKFALEKLVNDNDQLPESLVTEATAMLEALLADMHQFPLPAAEFSGMAAGAVLVGPSLVSKSEALAQLTMF